MDYHISFLNVLIAVVSCNCSDPVTKPPKNYSLLITGTLQNKHPGRNFSDKSGKIYNKQCPQMCQFKYMYCAKLQPSESTTAFGIAVVSADDEKPYDGKIVAVVCFMFPTELTFVIFTEYIYYFYFTLSISFIS